MAVRYEQQDDVAVITLDRPDVYNAISPELAQELAVGLARASEEARAAVITGQGRAFCSGADLATLKDEYESGSPDLGRLIREIFNPTIENLLEARVPTIAAINGVAAGAGMGLALACDLRVMGEDAFFMSAFIGLGLVPDSGSTWHLPHYVGLSKATEITMTNRRVPAAEAQKIGLAHRVTATDQVVKEAVEWAAELADGPTQAYVATRRLLREASGSGIEAALAQEEVWQGRLGRTPAHMEGVNAFLEKRDPNFRNVD